MCLMFNLIRDIMILKMENQNSNCVIIILLFVTILAGCSSGDSEKLYNEEFFKENFTLGIDEHVISGMLGEPTERAVSQDGTVFLYYQKQPRRSDDVVAGYEFIIENGKLVDRHIAWGDGDAASRNLRDEYRNQSNP